MVKQKNSHGVQISQSKKEFILTLSEFPGIEISFKYPCMEICLEHLGVSSLEDITPEIAIRFRSPEVIFKNSNDVIFAETHAGIIVSTPSFPFPPYNTIKFTSEEELMKSFQVYDIKTIDDITVEMVAGHKMTQLAIANVLLQKTMKNK